MPPIRDPRRWADFIPTIVGSFSDTEAAEWARISAAVTVTFS